MFYCVFYTVIFLYALYFMQLGGSKDQLILKKPMIVKFISFIYFSMPSSQVKHVFFLYAFYMEDPMKCADP